MRWPTDWRTIRTGRDTSGCSTRRGPLGPSMVPARKTQPSRSRYSDSCIASTRRSRCRRTEPAVRGGSMRSSGIETRSVADDEHG